MTVKVTERDDSHMSHEGVAAGVRIWDVYQQDLLVGMFHSETRRPQLQGRTGNPGAATSATLRLSNHRIENDKPRHERGLSLLQRLTTYHIRSSGI